MSKTDYDVIVIGGGSTGTAVVRDSAMRGLKTLLLERDDIASATVGTCAGMISSGFKYYNEPEFMDMCTDEVMHLRKIARHIVMKLPILFPVLDFSEISSGGVSKGMEEYAKRVERRGVPPFLILAPEVALELEPMLHPDVVASGYIEEFFIDPFRLSVLQAMDAKKHGADVYTYSEVTDLTVVEKEGIGVSYHNRLTGQIETVKGKVVINAAGPWAHKIAKLAGANLDLRLTKGSHIILDRRIVNVGITTRAVDRRWVYMYPHENTTLIGTTDLPTWENPDELVASHDEIEYLFKSFEWIVPSVREARIIRTMVGVRPMIPTWKVPEDEVSRSFEVVDHEPQGVSGLISFTGGKLVVCRRMAQDAVDLACEKLGKGLDCRTHIEPLPGMEGDVDILGLSEEHSISQHALERMRIRRGTEVQEILNLVREYPEWRSSMCTCEPVIEAEIRYAIRNEFPHTLNDLRRRLRLGTGPCQGTFCTFKAAAILAEELELNGEDYQLEIMDFLSERWKGKRPPMRGEQLAQEELVQGVYACVANLDQTMNELDYDLKPWEEVS
ncbi:MAG: FAD-dependent oxidoreductase [Candidatus Thorarchaeota archaeon]|nr:MAG: FAD-dependent oxidoreductase [Candidatus Thorarchaeota archaeon]